MNGRIVSTGKITHTYDISNDLEIFNRDLLAMIENSYDGVCIADGESRILLLNESFERVMGIPVKIMIGRKIYDLVREGLTDTSATLKVLETGREETVTINTQAGRQALSTGVPVYDGDGNITRVFCNLRDVTELIRLREKYDDWQKLASRYLTELKQLRSSRTARDKFITRNSEVKRIIELAYRVAQVDSSLLIFGESGVGKDMLSQMVHEFSPRNEKGSFVRVTCAAIPENLLESELFGYEPGAFTGARNTGKPGFFELADQGTLFLDEIGELPLHLQVKLLSVLQDRAFTRVGGSKRIKVDFRIIAATNRDLESQVREGRFREDLYYRLNVVPITLPSLRDRADDIPFLLAHFVDHYNQKYGMCCRFSDEALKALCRYDWPGNVRELKNLVERMIVTSQHSPVDAEQLPIDYQPGKRNGNSGGNGNGRNSGRGIPIEPQTLKQAVRDLENELVLQTMSESSTREEAAARLGLSLSSFCRRLKRAKSCQI